MTTTQPTAEQLRMARECAVSAVSTKLPGLMGNDFKGNIPKLRARIAKIRCAEGDHFVEVQSALLAIQATEARAQALVDALTASALRFREYEASHAAKGNLDGDAKARRNCEMAEQCEQALATWRRT